MGLSVALALVCLTALCGIAQGSAVGVVNHTRRLAQYTQQPRLEVGAEQIQVSLTPEPDEMVVFWVSPSKTSYVRYGTDPEALLNDHQSNDPQQYQYLGLSKKMGWKENYLSNWIHEVVLTGLEPSTTYYYQCGDSQHGMSQTFEFTTRSSNPDLPVRFTAFGAQDSDGYKSGTNANRLLQSLLTERSEDDFALHAGDVINAQGNQPLWDKYGQWMQPYTARVPIMYALGDEEGEFSYNPYKTYLHRLRHLEGRNSFWQPYWYSFTYGPVHVTVLSSEHESVNGVAVWDWLESDLQRADEPGRRETAPFIVLVLHRPMYNSGATGLSTEVARNIEPLLQRYRVSVVISSHCHNYERTKPMFNGQVVDDGRGSDRSPYVSNLFKPKDDGETHGVIHLSLGTGGRPGDRCPTKPWTVSNTMKLFGYGSFSVTRKTLRFKFIDIRGRTRDAFSVCSRSDCKNPPLLEGAETPYGSDEWKFGQECQSEAEVAALSSPDLSITSLGSGCPTDVVTSVPFKALFQRTYLQKFPENANTSTMVLPGGFIGDFVNNTATAAQLSVGQVDLYGASSDGVAVVLGVDVVFPMGTEMEAIHQFVRHLVQTPDSVYTSFPPGTFSIISDSIPTDTEDASVPRKEEGGAEGNESGGGSGTHADLKEGIKNKSVALWEAANATMFEAAEKMNFGHLPVLVYVFWGAVALVGIVLVAILLALLIRKFCCCCSKREGSSRSLDLLLRESHKQFEHFGKSPVRNSTVASHPVELTPGRTPKMTPSRNNRIDLSPTLGVLQMEPPASVPDFPFELNYVNAMNMRETLDSYVSGESGMSERDQFPGPTHQPVGGARPGADGIPTSPVASESSSKDAFEVNFENRKKRITSEDGFSMMPPAMLGSWGVQ